MSNTKIRQFVTVDLSVWGHGKLCCRTHQYVDLRRHLLACTGKSSSYVPCFEKINQVWKRIITWLNEWLRLFSLNFQILNQHLPSYILCCFMDNFFWSKLKWTCSIVQHWMCHTVILYLGIKTLYVHCMWVCMCAKESKRALFKSVHYSFIIHDHNIASNNTDLFFL